MMYQLLRTISGLVVLVSGLFILLMLTASSAWANGPDISIKPVLAPRNDPAPIPHSMVLDPDPSNSPLQTEGYAEDFKELALTAGEAAEEQDLEGEPGVLETVTDIASGITLFPDPDSCADFNRRGRWQEEVWTSSYEEWGLYARDDGFFQAKNVTFDREFVVGPGINYDGRHETSIKIASNQPYEAGVMSPPISARPGRTVRVVVNYLIYNHGMEAESLDFASMGIIPMIGESASYVYGYQRGQWSVLEQEVEAVGEEVIVMLQAHSPAALNSNIYFDNVRVYVNDSARGNCRR